MMAHRSSIRPEPLAAWLLPVVFLTVSIVCARLGALPGEKLSPAGGGPSAGLRLLSSVSRRPSLAFGFRMALADSVWIKAVQVVAPVRMTEPEFVHLNQLIGTIVRFDPRFKVPYLLGGIVLGESPKHAREALGLLDLGHRQFPDDWQMLFYSGYVRYFTLGDPVGGGTMLQQAARFPDSPPYLPFLASRMLSEGREPRTALAFLRTMLAQENDPGRRVRLERRVDEVIVERDLQMLEGAIKTYRRRTGHNPASPGELVASGILRKAPEEPFGGSYRIAPDGSVTSTIVRNRLRVFKP